MSVNFSACGTNTRPFYRLELPAFQSRALTGVLQRNLNLVGSIFTDLFESMCVRVYLVNCLSMSGDYLVVDFGQGRRSRVPLDRVQSLVLGVWEFTKDNQCPLTRQEAIDIVCSAMSFETLQNTGE